MKVLWPNHPFSKNSFSGQSPVTIGGGGGDMYMAACAYVYYRLYIITGDEHYHDLLNLFTIIRARQMMWTAALDMPFQAFLTKGAILQPKHSPATIIGCPG